MTTPNYIDPLDFPPGLDYQQLRRDGIAMLELLAGNTWTDYNEHDPGVTILEALCFAITNLGFKTTYSIPDLLANLPGHSDYEHIAKSNAFFTAAKILPNAPVTINDYRKLIIGSIASINNVWFIDNQLSINENNEVGTISGIYDVVVKPSYQNELKNELSEVKIKNYIRNLFNANRNFCEDLGDISIAKKKGLTIQAHLEIPNVLLPEDVFAEVLLSIDQFLNPQPKFHSLQALYERKNISPIDIFDGPFLDQGFLLESELGAVTAPKGLSTIKILERIAKVDNVVIKKVSLLIDNQKCENDWISLFDKNGYQVLALDELMFSTKDNLTYPISFYTYGVKRDLNVRIAIIKFEALKAKLCQSYRLNNAESNDFPIPIGNNTRLEQYYSIQNQFPKIYGISSDGLPPQASIERKAQAKQLKAYLLFFEQLMNNFLAQLTNVGNLFSIYKQSNTYFTQVPKDVPELLTLIQGMEIYPDELVEDKLKEFEAILKKIITKTDNFEVRRNKFLDHLLDRFGVGSEGLSWINSEKNVDEIQQKEELLQDYPMISSRRGQAYNYTDLKSFSILEFLIGRSLNIDRYPAKPLAASILDKNTIRFFQKTYKEEIIETISVETKISGDHLEVELIELVEYEDRIITPEINFFEDFVFSSNSYSILFSLLQYGIDPRNYSIYQEKDNAPFHLVFSFPDRPKPVIIAKFFNKKALLQANLELINFLKNINEKSQGFYIIEHLLLRPEANRPVFGFAIYDLQQQLLFKSCQPMNTAERLTIINQLKPADETAFRLEKVEQDGENFIGLFLKNQNQPIAKYCQPIDHSLSNKSQLGFVNQELKNGLEKNNYQFFVCLPNGKQVLEDFFSFQISIVFAGWSARFQPNSFRKAKQVIIKDLLPAHIHSNTYWLFPDEMDAFEKNYRQWKKLAAIVLRPGFKYKRHLLEKFSFQLIETLSEFQKKYNGTDFFLKAN